tara:strand:+ start:210 stop:2108 length:1899 start_codon:yes stop_codon:yes gene_type:complete
MNFGESNQMSAEKIERKIAVIFAADVVGYSKHMKNSEDNTLKSFKSCRKILDRLLEEHGGLIFNTAGDSILAEFTSAVSALVCASEFQKLIKERNSSGDAVVKLEFRIGINMGDVIKEGSNLYGDGVNIAARLETLAQKGGISLSKSVYEFVNSKTQFLFQDLGEQKVKDESFHAYDVLIDTAEKRILKLKKEKNYFLFGSIFVIFLIILGLSITYFPQSTQTLDQRSDNVIQDKLVGKTLLIKPFEVRSSSEDLSNISKSLTDHLIASLPSTILLNVVPRRKSYLVTEEAYSNERMQKALDVSFILSGSMSESKNRVRINLELSNIYDENIVWSSTEEFQKDDAFSAQDKLERIVRRAIQSNLTMGESFISYYEKNFSDYEDLLEIRRLEVATYKENVSIVKGLAQPYEKFVEKYKNSAAYALYALRLLQETNVVKDQGMMDVYNKAVRAQFQAYKLDPENARAIAMKAIFTLLNTGIIDEKLLEKAISIAPESFDVLYGVGNAYRFARKPLLAVGMYEKALNIAPLAPTDTKLNYLRALIDSKKFSKAERVSKEMTGLDKHSSYWGYLFLISIKFENNDKDDAARLYKEFSKLNKVSLDDIISEIKSYPWSWDVWYKVTLVDTLREIDKL